MGNYLSTSAKTSSAALYIGADISKSKIDFYYELVGKSYHETVENEFESIENYLQKTIKILGNLSFQLVMEATGTYGERLVYSSHKMGIPLSLISPIQSRAFMKSENVTTINDKQAARLLSLLGSQKKPPVYEIPEANTVEIKHLVVALDKLKEDLQRLENQIHASSYKAKESQKVFTIWQERRSELLKHIQTIENEIEQLTQTSFQEMIVNLCSIKGVGKTIATAFVIFTQGFAHFHNAKQLTKFVGLCPTQNDSGSSVRKGKSIPKQGVGILKALLFNAARSVLRSDNVFKRFFDKLKANGKNGKVALTAVMRKILTVIFAVAKSNSPFDPDFNKN